MVMDDFTFIRDVAERLGCDHRAARTTVSAVFRALRDRLTPEEAGDVAANLPPVLRSLWQEQERPGRAVERMRAREFFGRVRRSAGLLDDAAAERAVRAVFRELQTLLGSPHGDEGEAWDVFSQLPKDLKQLWLAAGRAH
jgi:uncharacterized protein (DUF2267 family)